MKKKISSLSYQKTLRQAHSELTSLERSLSRLVHRPTIDSTSSSLEQSFFRSTSMIIATLTSLGVGLFALGIASIFNYSVVSLTFLSVVFGLGFVIGLIYEYVRLLWRHK